MSSKSSIEDYKIDKNFRHYRIRANIMGSKLIHTSGFHSDYVEYYIRIETDYAKWTLKKRYEEINKLNTQLLVKIPEIKALFPPKRLLKSKDDTISERIKLFKKYFNYLFSNINIFLIDELLYFISLKSEIILLFIKKYLMLQIEENNKVLISLKNAYNKMIDFEEIKFQNDRAKKSSEDIISLLENENNYYKAILKYEMKRQISFNWDEAPSNSPNLFVIREFLNNLSEKSENKTEIIQTFEDFFQKEVKLMKLTKEEIKILYLGEESGKDKEAKEFLSKTNYNYFKKKKICADYKFHSSIEFLDDDTFFKNDDKEDEEEDYYLNINNNINGLFYIIGNYNKNVLLSLGALNFLNTIIDPEYNQDAEIFINIFKSCEIDDYKSLNLNKIIKSNIGGDKTNLKALKLLKLIFYDKKRDEFKRVLIEDNDVYKQYKNYLNTFIE